MPLIVCSESTKHYLKGEKCIVYNPPTTKTLELQGKYEDVIAIGGGAVIDTAKILSKNPITCYPTTAAGASATSHAVYWDKSDSKNPKKLNFKSHIPKKVKFESIYINSLPPHILLSTKYDAISHCLDVMWSKDFEKVNKKEVEETLKGLLNPEIRPTELIQLGHKAGSFIQIVPTTILHALSYPITGRYNISHGIALGFLIPPLCRIFNCSHLIKNLKILDKFVGIDINFTIEQAQTYSKFFNTKKNIDLMELKKELSKELKYKVYGE